MKTIVIILIVALALLGLVWFVGNKAPMPAINNGDNASSTPPANSISTGVLSWSYPDDWGLAVTNEQLRGMVQSYIPPCDENFDYCIYYNGKEFANTNFESAGVRVKKRADLANERLCLDTPPAGRAKMGNSSTSTNLYSASIFSPLSDAAAGHYSNGELYRLYLRQSNTCYEAETRIGETQFANYPAGTKERFDEARRDKIYAGFRSMLGSLKIAPAGEPIRLPDSED